MKMQLTISRNSDDTITFKVIDDASRGQFLELRMTPADLGMALTGLGFVHVNGVVRELHNVGLKKVTERRSKRCPLKSYDKAALRKWLAANCKEDGWAIDDYLGSQNSVAHNNDGSCTLNYSVFRYEAQPESAAKEQKA
jgi:hypothetical protein